jgi:multidrug resistance efflux pump
VVLWQHYIVPTSIVGEVESTHAYVISSVPGTIKDLKVQRFQQVKAGDEIAQISTMDAETLQASLRSIEAELKLMRARMQIDVERNENAFQQLRFEYLKERVELAWERVNSAIYDREVERQQQLLTTNRLVTLTEYDYWVRLAATSKTNVLEKERYLAEKERILPTLAPATKADEAVLEAIKAQEEALQATSQTISLKAPIEGTITFVAHHTGEKIVPNTPLATISANSATRIVGYLRRPWSPIPKPGDTVQIRRQSSFKREYAQGTVLEVSGQLEPIAVNLVPAPNGGTNELGLPFSVSIPAELALIPGEPVDLILNRK